MSPDKRKVLVHPSNLEMFGGTRTVWRQWQSEGALVVDDVTKTDYIQPGDEILLGGQTVQACLRNHLFFLAEAPEVKTGLAHVTISRLASWGWDVFDGGGADERSLEEIVAEINATLGVHFLISD